MKKTTKTKRRASQTPPHKPDDCPGCLISEVNDHMEGAFDWLGCNGLEVDVYEAVRALVEAQRKLIKLARLHGMRISGAPTLEADT